MLAHRKWALPLSRDVTVEEVLFLRTAVDQPFLATQIAGICCTGSVHNRTRAILETPRVYASELLASCSCFC
jgi:hypothetical protein